MNNITKVSEITYQDVANYIRLSEVSQQDQNTLTNLINISIAYIMGFTGLTQEQLDEHQDLIIVVLVLCQDMWDNRTLYVDNSNLNNVVDSILHMHSVNLL